MHDWSSTFGQNSKKQSIDAEELYPKIDQIYGNIFFKLIVAILRSDYKVLSKIFMLFWPKVEKWS